MDDFSQSVNIENIFYQVYKLVVGAEGFDVPDTLLLWWTRFEVVSILFSALLFAGIIYAVYRIQQIRIVERKDMYAGAQGPQSIEERKNEKWEHIVELANSENPREWRLAILEADIILDEMVSRMGYSGDTLGEKLKSIEQSDFTTLNEAWEAHKVRNAIAHEGSDFILTARETRRVIALFQKVFEEFHYI